MGDKNLKFKKNESFYIRDGWFEKAINVIHECNEQGVNPFSKNNGISLFGIGSNMVKSLKYWLTASKIIQQSSTKTAFDEFGELLFKHDRYLEDEFSWAMIHYNLCSNYVECPLFYGTFNLDLKSFKKVDLALALEEMFKIDGYENIKSSYIDDDLSILLKSYIGEGVVENPEDNYVCPLSSLHLLSKKSDKYVKEKPGNIKNLYMIVYYALLKLYKDKKHFQIEDTFDEPNSPYLIFNLDRNSYFQLLDEIRREGLITINKTAGLNTVYFEKELSLSEIYDLCYGGN